MRHAWMRRGLHWVPSEGLVAVRPVGMQTAGLVFSIVWAALSCGKVGPLKPPAPRGPLQASAVEVRQVGDRVEIALTVPHARGTEPFQQVDRTEILRVAYPRGSMPPPDPDAFRVRGEVVASVSADQAKPGDRIVVADPALHQLADEGIGWTLRYGARVRDVRGRPSPLVVAKDLTTVPPVAAPRALTGQASADGVRLAWEAPEGASATTYNVYRGSAEGAFSERPLNVQPLTTLDDLDGTVESGKTYRYVVRAVAAEGLPYRESVSSNPVVVDASDRFPPAPPAGLVAVQEGSAVRLLWNPAQERDLEGYRVYRALGDGAWTRIGGEVVRQPSCLDRGASPETVARYRVTSIDRAVPPNESGPSVEVELRVAEDPGTPSRTP